MEAIADDGTLQLDGQRELAVVQQGYTYFREGDVVIAKITPCFENGKGALIRGLPCGFGFGTTELIVVRPIPGRTLGRYLHWLFVSPDFRNRATAAMYGAGGQKRVPDDFVRDFAVALPPVSEQGLISAFLDRETGKIDALVAEQERLVALLMEKRQAVIAQAVTKGLDPNVPMRPSGVEWLAEVPAHWSVKRVKRVARLESGHTPSKQFPEYWDEGDIDWVSLNDSKHLSVHDYISDTALNLRVPSSRLFFGSP
jgi:type I restriction enzyme, S subunit